MAQDAPTSNPALFVHLACVIAACAFAIRLRGVLSSMQERVFVTAWQLRQLLPERAGRRATATSARPGAE
jgi:hypothetical protein